MQLLSEQEKAENELRRKIEDISYIQQLKSELAQKQGIENSEKRFKIHQFTQSAMMLPGFKDYARLRPLIDGLIEELNPADFLGCSAALEMLADICASRKENIQYFEQIGLLNKVYNLFNMSKQNPDLGPCHTACIRFFGYLSTADPNSLQKFPLFMADVFDAVYRFDSLDMLRRKLTFETLAIITTTSGAKKYLSGRDCPYDMNKAMNHLGAAVATGAGMPQLKASYLDSVRVIFDSFDPTSPTESPLILQNWFNQLGKPFPLLLFQCLKEPIVEIQNASFLLMLTLMRHDWALAHFCSISRFFDFILSREIVIDTIGKQLKYDLVVRLIDLPQIDSTVKEQLRDYASQGPYAPSSKLDIATEGTG